MVTPPRVSRPHQHEWSVVYDELDLPLRMVCSGCPSTITPDTDGDSRSCNAPDGSNPLLAITEGTAT